MQLTPTKLPRSKWFNSTRNELLLNNPSAEIGVGESWPMRGGLGD